MLTHVRTVCRQTKMITGCSSRQPSGSSACHPSYQQNLAHGTVFTAEQHTTVKSQQYFEMPHPITFKLALKLHPNEEREGMTSSTKKKKIESYTVNFQAQPERA